MGKEGRRFSARPASDRRHEGGGQVTVAGEDAGTPPHTPSPRQEHRFCESVGRLAGTPDPRSVLVKRLMCIRCQRRGRLRSWGQQSSRVGPEGTASCLQYPAAWEVKALGLRILAASELASLFVTFFSSFQWNQLRQTPASYSGCISSCRANRQREEGVAACAPAAWAGLAGRGAGPAGRWPLPHAPFSTPCSALQALADQQKAQQPPVAQPPPPPPQPPPPQQPPPPLPQPPAVGSQQPAGPPTVQPPAQAQPPAQPAQPPPKAPPAITTVGSAAVLVSQCHPAHGAHCGPSSGETGKPSLSLGACLCPSAGPCPPGGPVLQGGPSSRAGVAV